MITCRLFTSLLILEDVVTEYSFGESESRLDYPDWSPEYYDASMESAKTGSLLKQMIWIYHLIDALPVSVQAALSPSLKLILGMQKVGDVSLISQLGLLTPQKNIENIIVRIKQQPSSTYPDLFHPTLFHELLQSNLPESDKTVARLRDEALIVVGAGTITTSWALCVAVFYLLTSPDLLKKLKAELEAEGRACSCHGLFSGNSSPTSTREAPVSHSRHSRSPTT